MKRVLSFFTILFFAFTVFAKTTNDAGSTFFFNGSFGTGTIVYGDSTIKEYINTIQSDGYSRIVLTADAGLGIAADEHIRFTLGATTACDFYSKSGGSSSNFIDYAFFSGIRLYPSSTGFNFAAEYVTGRRSDFITASKTSIGSSYKSSSTSWGNGFRFLLEYDFRHNDSGFAPVVGGSWRHMPRGGYDDDIWSLYFRFSFR